MKLSERMVEYRGKKRISMQEAAAKAGVALTTWMYVERGLQTPTRMTAAKIEQLVGKED